MDWKAEISNLVVYLPELEANIDDAVEFDDGFHRYPDPINDFFSVLQREPWVVQGYQSEREARNLRQRGYVESADLDQLRGLLTFIARHERFRGGAWDEAIRSGCLRRILERLSTLSETMH